MGLVKINQAPANCYAKCAEHWEADQKIDIAQIPDCVPGSTVKVLEDDTVYELDALGDWHKQGESGGSGGGGVQPDWNQNDPAAADYVKNRPFGGVVELVEQYNGVTRINKYTDCGDLIIKAGNIYDVKWDGVDYDGLIAYCGDDLCTNIGNPTSNDGPYPFNIYYYPGDSSYIEPKDKSVEHTVVITLQDVSARKLPPCYLNGLLIREGSGDSAELFNSASESSGWSSHAEGMYTVASGSTAHAEGYETVASGENSHAEGYETVASENASHAEGRSTEASGHWSHAEGSSTKSMGEGTHAEGLSTVAQGEFQHVQGKYNVEDTANKYAHIVGNGSYRGRSNAHTLDWEGNAWYAGSVEGTALIVKSSVAGSTKRFKITVDDTGTISATEVT